MKQLERLDPSDADFDRTTRQLINDIRHHAEDEEHDLLPRLRETCSAEQLQDLGNKTTLAKASAPNRPPANMILDPGAGLIDRMRDAMSGRNR